VVAWAAKARGFDLLAIAPGISATVVAVSAIAAPVFGIAWSLLPLLGLTAVMTIIAYPIASLLSRRKSVPTERTAMRYMWRPMVGHGVAIVLAATLIGRRIITALGEPESFSQTFDNVFHLNAVRYIEDTGSGSSLTLNSMTGAGFYPAAWHDFVALVVDATGAGIPLSANVFNLIVAALVWPMGCIFLARTILGKRLAVSFIAAILSAAFGAFPISLLDFGVLYPNFLGNALLPIGLALGIRALGLAHQKSYFRTLDSLLLLAVLPGISLAHPSSTMALMVLMLPPLLHVWGTTTVGMLNRRGTVRWRALAISALVLIAGALLLAAIWKIVRPPEVAAFWPPVETSGQAIGEVISSAGIGRSVAWGVMVLTVVGLLLAVLKMNQLWTVGIFSAGAFLFVVVASFPFGELRTIVSGIWYNDPPRLAALLPLVTLPIATRGALELWDRWLMPLVCQGIKIASSTSAHHLVTGRARSTSTLVQKGPILLAAAVLIIILTVSTQQANVREAQDSMADSYRLTENSPLISSDELALIKRLPNEVPQDATMVSNPWNGSALAYAFANRKLLQLHILSAVPDGVGAIINGPSATDPDPATCATEERLGIGYVLDFGHREVHGGDHGYRGLDELIAVGSATLEDSQGEAKLYKIDSCGR